MKSFCAGPVKLTVHEFPAPHCEEAQQRAPQTLLAGTVNLMQKFERQFVSAVVVAGQLAPASRVLGPFEHTNPVYLADTVFTVQDEPVAHSLSLQQLSMQRFEGVRPPRSAHSPLRHSLLATHAVPAAAPPEAVNVRSGRALLGTQ